MLWLIIGCRLSAPNNRPIRTIICSQLFVAFSALKPLVEHQEGHPVCKNRVVGCWRGYLSGARCRLAYGPAGATATHCLLHQ